MLIHGSKLCKFRIFLNKHVDDHKFYNDCILV